MSGTDWGQRPVMQAALTVTVIAAEDEVRMPSDDGFRNTARRSDVERITSPTVYVPAVVPGFILRTSAQLDPVRCCRTTVRPLIALFDSLPVPALPSAAVNVTTDPARTEVRVAVIVSCVGMSRQVLYSVLLFATS